MSWPSRSTLNPGPFTGFGLEFKRNYDLTKTKRRHEALELAEVDDQHVVDVPGDGRATIDINPHDTLETEARKVDPPIASRTPLDPEVQSILY
jgi:hypothetical protein